MEETLKMIGGFVLFLLIIGLLIFSIQKYNRHIDYLNDRNEYLDSYLGKQVVIANDTLEILKRKCLNDVFILSNGVEIDLRVVEQKLIK